MKKYIQCGKGRLKNIFYTLLCIAIFCTLVSYQILWQYRTEVFRLDSPTYCNIPLIDPHSKSAKILIEVNGKFDGAPPCIGASVKFQIQYQNFSLVRGDSASPFWDTVDCCYTVFQRDENKIINGDECFPITGEYTSLPYEHQNLDIKCSDKANHQVVYRDQLPCFRTNPVIEADVDEIASKISSEERLSVLILGLDSVSHQNMVRYMPKSYRFLIDDLSALEFFGFNKVGSGTIANVIAMLSGCRVLNPLDPPYKVEEHCELLWQEYIDKGFRTIHLEDSAFNEKGLYPSIRKNRPGIGTHYNLSDFMDGVRMIDENEMGNTFEDGFGCFDNQFVLDVFADPILEVAKVFADKPYLNFVWFGKTGHAVMSNTKYMDEPIHRIMSDLKTLQLLENTALFIVADHGPWHGAYLATDAGALERLMPTLFVSFPQKFKTKYPRAFQNMKLNSKRLTTQYDLYHTLSDLSDLSRITDETLSQRIPQERSHQLGQSLFLTVPLERTCESANIPSEYCMCWMRSSISDPASNVQVQQATAYSVIHLNSEIQLFPLCAPVTLKSIEMASRLGSRFQDSGTSQGETEFLEVTFTTYPADAEFQATVSFYPKMQIIGQVLRTNVYKGQSDCIGSWKNATYAKTMCLCTGESNS